MSDVDPTGDRTYREDDQPKVYFADLRHEVDLAARRHAELSEHADDLVAERDSLRDQLADAMAAGQSMEGQCNDLAADIKVQTDAADAAAEAVGNMAEKLSTLLAENARLQEDLARERWVRLEGDTDRDRLRAVVDGVLSALSQTVEDMCHDDTLVVANLYARLAAQLDVSPTIGGDSDG